ncbi:hypothetical protein SDC9_104178 [bioreactor metagenome]|uniref:Uncharacterized protein n=1 Tax=bioreactor metagenome TaxID=1076179 RepID=A0A645AX35_9ZZZZ|nr:hypothetical protein [Erysipelotrichales bacterium]
MKICKVVTILFVLMLVTSSVFAAPGGQAGGAVNPPGQTTYGPDDWSLSDCIQWSREAGFWNVENQPNDFVHWWLFGYTE